MVQDGSASQSRVWYLPHHAVIHPAKPEKIRVVFDASAKHQGVSLNDVLLKGPDLTENLATILLRFRNGPIAVSSDIEKMFLQVGVKESDQRALRFVWRPPGSTKFSDTYQMKVQVFGAVSSPTSCSFVLQNLAETYKKQFPGVAPKVRSRFYVDNYLDSFDSVDEAVDCCRAMSSMLIKGGFRLTKWTSSSDLVLNRLKQGQCGEYHDFDIDHQSCTKTLGLMWDRTLDEFFFRTNPEQVNTKRGILSVMTRVYAPVLMTAKIIQREIWQADVGWDEAPPAALLKRLDSWRESLHHVEKLRIPRCVRPGTCDDIQLHMFSDASQLGYCAAVYLRVRRADGTITIRLITAKGRVAPIKYKTIPKLELESSLIGLRLALFSEKSLGLQISSSVYWSDSSTVVAWVNSKKSSFPVFVANRVGEIWENSKVDQ